MPPVKSKGLQDSLHPWSVLAPLVEETRLQGWLLSCREQLQATVPPKEENKSLHSRREDSHSSFISVAVNKTPWPKSIQWRQSLFSSWFQFITSRKSKQGLKLLVKSHPQSRTERKKRTHVARFIPHVAFSYNSGYSLEKDVTPMAFIFLYQLTFKTFAHKHTCSYSLKWNSLLGCF